MNEKQKDFLAALGAIIYLTSISFILIAFNQQITPLYPDDLTNYFNNNQLEKHPIPIHEIYFLLAKDKAAMGFLACLVPTLVFCILIHLKSNRRYLYLALVSLPFLFTWWVMAQNLCILFFIFAIALKENRALSAILFCLGCLSHRLGGWLGLLIVVVLTLPFERIKGVLDRMKDLVIYALIAILAISLIYPCGFFSAISRAMLIFCLWLWASFKSDDARMTALFIALAIIGTGANIVADGNRILLILQPIVVLGYAIQRKAVSNLMLAYLLITGLFFIFSNIAESSMQCQIPKTECKPTPALIQKSIDIIKNFSSGLNAWQGQPTGS